MAIVWESVTSPAPLPIGRPRPICRRTLRSAVHDKFATESGGAIQDRTTERLGSTDKAIAASRQLLLKAIRDVQEQRDPPHVVRDETHNDFHHMVVMSQGIDDSADWRTNWASLAKIGDLSRAG